VICDTYQSIDLEEWGRILSAPLEGGRYPMSVSFEPTARCNMNCVHCYINKPPKDEVARRGELSTVQTKSIIDQMVDAGVLFLTLTGGEPLLRPDFVEIYTYARSKGLLVILFTNGTMITEEIADLLKDIRPFNVEISLYGATPEVYEAVTRVPGSYAKCVRGIKLIHERGIPLTLKTELMTLNFQELAEMKAFADGLGVKFRYDGLLWPRLDGTGKFPQEVQLPIETLVAFDTNDFERQESVGKEIIRLGTLKTRDERVFSCGAGLRNFHLDSEGRMSICIMLRQPSYSLLEVPLMQAWEKIGELRKLKRTMPSPCSSCDLNILCSQCPGWSQAIHGNMETVVEYICNHGKLRSMNALRSQEIELSEIINYE